MKLRNKLLLAIACICSLSILSVFLILAAEDQPQIINNIDFNGYFDPAVHVLVTEGTDKISLGEEDGVTFANFRFGEGDTKDGERLDFGGGQLYQNYTVDIRLKVNEISDGSFLGLLESKNEKRNDFWLGYTLGSDGSLAPYWGRGGDALATCDFGRWVRLSFSFHVEDGKVDVYVDGKYQATDEYQQTYSDGSLKLPEMFKITYEGDITSMDIDIDWIRVYTGNKVLPDDELEELSKTLNISNTIMDSEEKALSVLGNGIVVMTSNNTYYMNGEKQTYGEGCSAIEVDDVPMISDGLLAVITGTTWQYSEADNTLSAGDRSVALSLPAKKVEGAWYYPVESVATQILEKKFTYDERGCAIIADNSYTVQRDHYVDRYMKFYDSDVIYRYMQFDQESGYKIIETLKNNMPNNQHPRLLFTDSDIAYILNKVEASKAGGDATWKMAYDAELKAANAEVLKDNTAYYNATGGARQNAASTLQASIKILARAYLLSGDEQYAEKGVEILEALIAWDSLEVYTSNLIGGHWMAAVAIGYDSFYDYLMASDGGEAILEKTRDVAYVLALFPYYQAYFGTTVHPSCITIQDNFTGVCCGGLMSLLISIADEDDYPDMYAYLLENCMKTLQIGAGLYYPDGGYYESVAYSTYMMGNFSIALVGMKNGFNSYYGLDKAEGFADYGYFLTFMQSTDTNVNYHDGGVGYQDHDTALREIWAYLFDDPMQAALAKRQQTLRGKTYNLEELFFYTKATEGKEDQITEEKMDAVGTDRYFYSAESGAFSSSMTDKNPTFVGIHGGLTGLPHDMLDLGEFIFEAEGVKWATDMGRDNYDLLDYFQIPNGYQYYLKRPEGKNCIMINPNNTEDARGNIYYGQTVNARAELINIDMNQEFGAFAVYDLTKAYFRDVTKYQRGYYFGDNRSTLIVQDEIKFRGSGNEMYWFMQLPIGTTITIEDGGQRAILKNSGKTLVVEMKALNMENATFVAMDHEPIKLSMQDGELQIDGGAWRGQQKLAIHATGLSGEATLTVKLMPNEAKLGEYDAVQICPMADWIVSEDMFTGAPEDIETLPPQVTDSDTSVSDTEETPSEQPNSSWIDIVIGAVAVVVIAVVVVVFVKRAKKN